MTSDLHRPADALGQPLGSMTVAQVKRVDDPQGLGRITVLVPGENGASESGWLQVMSFYGGQDSGALFAPNVGDSALVSFVGSDLAQGFVLGFLWNGSTKPPVDASRQREVRVIKTRQGKQLIFDDSQDGQLTLIDEHQNKVQIDTVHNRISVESQGDVAITAANTLTLKARQVVIQNASGSVKLDLGETSLQALGGQSMKLNATLIDIN